MSSTPQTTDYHAKYLAHLLLKRVLLDEISTRLEQKEELEELFTIKWRVL